MFWVELKLPGPLHNRLAPGVLELPLIATLGLLQKRVLPWAKTFGGVSREALVRRLLIVGLVSETFYEQKRKQYQEEYKRQAKRTVIVLPHIKVISTVGKPFSSLVFNALYQEKITTSDVADYFEVRLKHLDRIEQMTRTSLDAI